MKAPILFENKKFYEKEKKFSQFGSVVQLIQFFFSEITESDYNFSRFVAKEAVEVLKNRNAEFYKKLDNQNQNRYYFNLGFYGSEVKDVEGKEPKGKKIGLQEFLGHNYSLKFREIIHRATNGLSYALCKPPYLLNYREFTRQHARELSRKNLDYNDWEHIKLIQTRFINNFLHEIELEIDKEEQLIIYEWDDNWSHYFDAGKEWWGTFFWTILNNEKGKITVLCASTTD